MDRRLLGQLQQLLRPLAMRVANTVARGVLKRVDDARKQQLVQLGVLAGETIDDGEHFQPYGLSSVPLGGAEAVVLFPNGDRSHPLVVAVSDRRHRPTGGEPGEVTIYNHTGATVVIDKDGNVVVTPAAGGKVKIGSGGASTPPAMSTELADFKARIATWVPVPNDGGASLKAVISAWPVAGATKVDVE